MTGISLTKLDVLDGFKNLKSVLDTNLMEKILITCLLPRISKRDVNQFMKKYLAGTKVQRVQGRGRICQPTQLNMFVELKS